MDADHRNRPLCQQVWLSLAVVVTLLNIVPPMIVMSAPESIRPNIGTPWTCTLTHRYALPESWTLTTLTLLPSSESDKKHR